MPWTIGPVGRRANSPRVQGSVPRLSFANHVADDLRRYEPLARASREIPTFQPIAIPAILVLVLCRPTGCPCIGDQTSVVATAGYILVSGRPGNRECRFYAPRCDGPSRSRPPGICRVLPTGSCHCGGGRQQFGRQRSVTDELRNGHTASSWERNCAKGGFSHRG